MLDLVYKDFRAAFWFLLGALPIYLLQLITLRDTPPAGLVVTLIFATMFAFGSVIIEETQGTEVTWNSLPVGRDRIVLARYLTATLGVLLGVIPTWAISGSTLGIGLLALLFFMLQGSIALFLPFYFCHGAGKGLAIYAFVTLGFLIAMAALRAVVAAVTETAFVPDPRAIEEMAVRLAAVEGLLAAGFVILALVLTAGSAALAVRWYAARDC